MKHRCNEIKKEHPQVVHDESCTMDGGECLENASFFWWQSRHII